MPRGLARFRPVPDRDIIETLELTLRLAREGKVIGLALFSIEMLGAEDYCRYFVHGTRRTTKTRLIGEIEAAKHQLCEDLNAELTAEV